MATTKTIPAVTPRDVGCWLDHANYSAIELDMEVIEIAESYGYEVKDFPPWFSRGNWDVDELDEDTPQTLFEISEDAIDYLNDLLIVSGNLPYTYWGHDSYAGSFGLWPDWDGVRDAIQDGDCEQEDDPPDDPPDEGEPTLWCYTTDHGNVTLYEWNGTDWVEVWSIV